jgi:hypothetical protein
MWPFKKKKFTKKIPGLPENWKELIKTCNFTLARKELAGFFEIANRQAEQEGKAVYYRNEFVRGWEAFANRPCYETAVAFIEGASDYGELVWSYLIECCPGGRWSYYDSLLSDNGPSDPNLNNQ